MRTLSSPAALAIGGLSADDASEVAKNHLDRWLNWCSDSESQQLPARSRGAMNARDDKLRQTAYLAERDACVAAYGEDLGNRMSAGFVGPLAEAYVGGGS